MWLNDMMIYQLVSTLSITINNFMKVVVRCYTLHHIFLSWNGKRTPDLRYTMCSSI